jgi:hypothetical protein
MSENVSVVQIGLWPWAGRPTEVLVRDGIPPFALAGIPPFADAKSCFQRHDHKRALLTGGNALHELPDYVSIRARVGLQFIGKLAYIMKLTS